MTEETLTVEKTKEMVKNALEEHGSDLSPKHRSLLEQAAVEIAVNNKTPKEAFHVPPESLEVIYQQGYLFYQNGKYKEALDVFNVLRFLDFDDSRYTFAIAACYHSMKEYFDAAANYLMYKQMNPLNPLPSYHLYDCFKKMDYPFNALVYIEEALRLADIDPKYAPLKEKMEVECQGYHEFLKTYYQNKYNK